MWAGITNLGGGGEREVVGLERRGFGEMELVRVGGEGCIWEGDLERGVRRMGARAVKSWFLW